MKFTSFEGNDHAQIANHVAFSRLCHDRVNGFATALFGPFDSRAKLEKSLRLNQKNSKHFNAEKKKKTLFPFLTTMQKRNDNNNNNDYVSIENLQNDLW